MNRSTWNILDFVKERPVYTLGRKQFIEKNNKVLWLGAGIFIVVLLFRSWDNFSHPAFYVEDASYYFKINYDEGFEFKNIFRNPNGYFNVFNNFIAQLISNLDIRFQARAYLAVAFTLSVSDSYPVWSVRVGKEQVSTPGHSADYWPFRAQSHSLLHNSHFPDVPVGNFPFFTVTVGERDLFYKQPAHFPAHPNPGVVWPLFCPLSSICNSFYVHVSRKKPHHAVDYNLDDSIHADDDWSRRFRGYSTTSFFRILSKSLV